MQNKKVLIIYHKIGYGGANKMLVFLANTLAKHKFDVTIYTYASSEKPFYELDGNITHIKENKYNQMNRKNKLFQFLKIRKLIGNSNPNIVISFMSTSNFFSILGTRFKGIPVIVSERGDPNSEVGFFAKIKQKSLGFAEGAVFQTEGARDFFSEKLKKKSAIIPNPVIEVNKKILPWKQRDCTISFVARFDVKQKRQDIMVEAFARISTLYPEYKLVFYGDGEGVTDIKNLVNSHSLNKKVIFKGSVSNVIDEIIKSKLFVLSSDYEGIPNALIEAMSVGLPCISTDCDPGGARLLIKNDINGILIPKGDITSLTEAIIKLINDPLKADSLGQSAKEINQEFNISNIELLWINYIEKVISENKR